MKLAMMLAMINKHFFTITKSAFIYEGSIQQFHTVCGLLQNHRGVILAIKCILR